MTFAGSHIRTTIEGVFGTTAATPVEQWRTTFKIATQTVSNGYLPSNLLAFVTAISNPIAAFHVDTTLGSGSTCFFTATSAAWIADNGQYVGGGAQPTTRYVRPTPTAGNGGPTKPLSTALVLTLRSTLERGRASHGRMYWPALATSISGPDMRLSAGQCTTIAGAAKTMLDAINTQAVTIFGTGHKVSLESNVGVGLSAPVVRVGVGRKMDSMESRERSLLEEHQYSTLAVSALLMAEREEELDRIFEAEIHP